MVVLVFTMVFKFLYTLIYPLHLIIKHGSLALVSVFTMAFKFLYTLLFILSLELYQYKSTSKKPMYNYLQIKFLLSLLKKTTNKSIIPCFFRLDMRNFISQLAAFVFFRGVHLFLKFE